MGRNGARYPADYIDSVIHYVEKMIADERVIVLSDDQKTNSVVFCSVCHDYRPFYIKWDWEYIPHQPDGKIVYTEKLLSECRMPFSSS